MTSKGVVTAKKAGEAELVVMTNAKTVDDVDYGATTTEGVVRSTESFAYGYGKECDG